MILPSVLNGCLGTQSILSSFINTLALKEKAKTPSKQPRKCGQVMIWQSATCFEQFEINQILGYVGW